jgi:PucR family transcriptional regulator, purine catabolism regulatory protein
MSLTVQQLTEIESLRTRFVAGHGGGDRPVTWAHSTELPDPWNWLGAGDLLLTNGYNIPAEAEEQVELLNELNRANISGIAFSGRPEAPPLTPAALRAADELCFPVLETEYSVPWVALSRIVADSNTEKSSARLIKVLREYDVLRRSYSSGAVSNRLLDQLSKECDCILHVIDAYSGAPLLPTTDPISDGLREAVLTRLRAEAPPPAFTRVTWEGAPTIAIPATGDHRAVLLATATQPEHDLDLIVLQHAATIAGLEVERRAAVAARRRESGGQLLHQLLSGTIDAEAALTGLKAFGLDKKPWQLISWGAESQLTIEEMQRRLAAAKVPNVLGRYGSEDVALVPAGAVGEELNTKLSHPGLRLGASLPIHSVSRMNDALREARWALEGARASQSGLTVYGENEPLFLPRSVAEGEAVVAQLLGPVLEYDEANETQLMGSLVAYLDANRSWQEAASALGIHRQTLMYRIRRIEEITGRRLQNLADQTELFLAVRTWKMLHHGGGTTPFNR